MFIVQIDHKPILVEALVEIPLCLDDLKHENLCDIFSDFFSFSSHLRSVLHVCFFKKENWNILERNKKKHTRTHILNIHGEKKFFFVFGSRESDIEFLVSCTLYLSYL